MMEGTLVALLALVGGWLRSRLAAILLMLLMALGLATGLAVGAATGGLLLQVALFGVALRMVEGSFRFRRDAPPGVGRHGGSFTPQTAPGQGDLNPPGAADRMS